MWGVWKYELSSTLAICHEVLRYLGYKKSYQNGSNDHHPISCINSFISGINFVKTVISIVVSQKFILTSNLVSVNIMVIFSAIDRDKYKNTDLIP